MDPQFEPGRQLLEKAKDPMAAIDLDPVIARYQAQESLNVDECLIQAIELFNNREFSRTLEVLSKVMAVDPSNAEARDIMGRAQEKMEAMPFVQQFVKKAQTLAYEGDATEARKQVIKGLALDEGNPDLMAIQAQLDGAGGSAAEEPGMFELPPGLAPGTPTLETAGAPPAGSVAEDEEPGMFSLPPEISPATPVVEPPADALLPDEPPSFAFEAPAPEPVPPQAMPPPVAEENPFAFADAVPAAVPVPPAEPDLLSSMPAPPSEPVPELEVDGGRAPVPAANAQDEKIRTLLADGDRAMMQNEYQEAIDIWSRIFLIDVHSEEASQKIEGAKRLLAEQDRQIEEMFNLAVGLFNQGKKAEARAKFEEVLGLEPHHLAARNYVRQLDDEEGKTKPAQAMPEAAHPEIEEVLPTIPQVAVVRDEEKPKRKLWLPIAAVLGVMVLLVAGWFFLGGGSGLGKSPVNAAATIAQAEALYSQGKAAEAQAELMKVPPEDALYGKALSLLTTYRSGPRKKPVDTIGGRPAEQVAAEWRDQAYQSYQAKNYELAKEYYTKVAGIRPLSLEDKAFLDDINSTLEAITVGRSAFDTGNFDQAIATLQPIYDRDRVVQARDILVKAHYDRGVNALREENLGQAEPDFQAILKLDEGDEMAKKNLRLIQRYKDANKDLLYRTYVKYLKPR